MTDNSAALRRARRRDSALKRQRAADTITAIEASGERVSFPTVARRAGVSVSLLYADSELASRVAAARDRQQQAGSERAWRLPARSLVTEQSLRADLANAKEQVQRLNEEVVALRGRLARQLGADADIARGRTAGALFDKLEQRNAELEAENRRLCQQLSSLQADNRELTDTLGAARALNRDLMSELNRQPPRPGV
jgi:chromosome segregation ATPase